MAQTTNPTVTGLTVVTISDTQWRISDATQPENDGRALLAFIERVGSLYEVTELAKPWRRTYFSSLSGALEMLSPANRKVQQPGLRPRTGATGDHPHRSKRKPVA